MKRVKDDYLWDASGDPDPEIQRMETILRKFRHDGAIPEFPQTLAISPRARRLPFLSARLIGLAAVGAVILILIAAKMIVREPGPAPATEPGWNVARQTGSPRVGAKTIDSNTISQRLGVGQILETDSLSRASITVDQIGEVQIEPDTRVRLIKTTPQQKRLALERGTIHAAIWAPAGEFVVDTPGALAVDLGCAYTLHVDDTGAGMLHTTLGWVGFKLDGHESFIPAGAACPTRPKLGPGTPYFEDASEALRSALSKLDFEAHTPQECRLYLDVVLHEARSRDALTLWHLLVRASDADRGLVYQRLAAFVPPPPGVTHDPKARLDQKMLDLWWNELGLGDVSLWRNWERSWSPGDGNSK
jgi:hypothetical protein